MNFGISSGNKPHPSTGTKVIKDDDPKIKFCLKTVDPRIHFALNCGAKVLYKHDGKRGLNFPSHKSENTKI